MSKSDPTISERTRRYRQRQKDQGLVEVKTRVPKDKRDALLAYAEKLRKSVHE